MEINLRTNIPVEKVPLILKLGIFTSIVFDLKNSSGEGKFRSNLYRYGDINTPFFPIRTKFEGFFSNADEFWAQFSIRAGVPPDL